MKNVILLVIISFITSSVFSQDLNKIINANEIHWYGIDFTKAKMIGSIGFTHPDIICERYIQNKWNTFVFSESKKYNISKFTGDKKIIPYLDFILNRNSVVTTDNLIINSEYQISENDIQNVINEYPQSNTGVGLVFIVESFNKLNETANIWVTFFNIENKQVLITKKHTVKPGGFGVLNYWLGGIYQTCLKLRKDFKKWKKI